MLPPEVAAALQKVSPALETPVSYGMPNEPITLFTGTMEASQQGATFQADAKISLHWLPFPRIRFEIPEVPGTLNVELGDISLRLPDGTEIDRARVTSLNPFTRMPGFPLRVSGVIDEAVSPLHDTPAAYVLFILPNFEDIKGAPIRYPNNSVRAARTTLCGGGWRVTVDEAQDLERAKNSLQSSSGFAVTHLGRLEHEDGTTFTATEARKALDAFGCYVSFCCGRWAGPCLPHGFDASGQQIWETWDVYRTSAYHQRISWMDPRHTEHFEHPFAGFMKRWQDDAWSEVIQAATHWFVEANAQAGSVEGSIVLTQTAFEALASVVLVETQGWLSSEGYEKLPAFDRIRLLLAWCGIPTAIPAGLPELSKLAKSNGWPDTSTAMTLIRNTITHPTRKNRERFGMHPSEARSEAWALGLWNLELCLLRLFDYDGTYGSRLINRWLGVVTSVPWRKP
jgi:hypothetical protein